MLVATNVAAFEKRPLAVEGYSTDHGGLPRIFLHRINGAGQLRPLIRGSSVSVARLSRQCIEGITAARHAKMIRGFGSFRTRQRQPRVGRNPKTGTRVDVLSKRIPYFKPSKELKDLVNHSEGPTAPPEPPAAAGETSGH